MRSGADGEERKCGDNVEMQMNLEQTRQDKIGMRASEEEDSTGGVVTSKQSRTSLTC